VAPQGFAGGFVVTSAAAAPPGGKTESKQCPVIKANKERCRGMCVHGTERCYNHRDVK
jgi:hypothetical protein